MNRLETLINPEKPFRFVYKEARMPSDWEQFHAHQGVELLYIHKGSGNIIIDKKLFPITDNTLAIIQPYQLHKFHVQISTFQPYIRTVMIFEPTAMERFFTNFTKQSSLLKHIWKRSFPNQVLYDEEGSDLQTLFLNMGQKRDVSPDEEDIGLFLLNVFSLLNQRLLPNSETTSSDQNRIAHHTEIIMGYIEKNYRDGIKLNQIARELHLSESYISRLFHKYTGFTVMDYTNAVRLREACLLLVATSLSIKEICAKTGISSSSYLCQLFRKHYNLTPNQYRNFYGNQQIEIP